MSGDYKFYTLSLHAGHVPDERHGSRAVPIHQTTSYVFQDTRHAAALYNMEIGGHLYSRISNPTVAVLEQRLAALEGAAACTATASGMAAPPPPMFCKLLKLNCAMLALPNKSMTMVGMLVQCVTFHLEISRPAKSLSQRGIKMSVAPKKIVACMTLTMPVM